MRPTARNLLNCKIAKGPYKKHHRKCEWCGKKLPKRRRRWCSDRCGQSFYNNHHWNAARRAARKRDGYKCVQCGSKEHLEVNHIVPCLGKHHEAGCWHHLSNLETLCHEHHVVVTRQQKAAGLFDRC
jgi:5-methylcytosine-specific restriction endonuclease McrA